MNKTTIGWAEFSWNPIVGSKEEPVFHHAKGVFDSLHKKKAGFEYTEPHLMPERLAQPGQRKKPARILVGSMTDLFAEWVPSRWIEKILGVARNTHWHTFQFLTRNPRRYWDFGFPPNAWLGAVANDQEQAEAMMEDLDPFGGARIRYLSCEPMEGPIVLDQWPELVILGGRPERAWVDDVVTGTGDSGAALFLRVPALADDYDLRQLPGEPFPADF